MGRWVWVVTGLVVLGSGDPALAGTGKPCLTAEALAENYKKNCAKDTEELRQFLLSNKVQVFGSDKAAADVVIAACDHDEVLKMVTSENSIRDSEADIEKDGAASFAAAVTTNLETVRTTNGIDKMRKSAEMTHFATDDDIAGLQAFEDMRALTDSTVDIVKACP